MGFTGRSTGYGRGLRERANRLLLFTPLLSTLVMCFANLADEHAGQQREDERLQE